MLQTNSILLVVDNSGAKRISVIRCLGGSTRHYAGIGNLVVASVKKANPNSPISKGDIVTALIVSTKSSFYRDGSRSIKFNRNCAVLINKTTKEPLGTRIFIPLLFEFNEWGYQSLFSLAKEIL